MNKCYNEPMEFEKTIYNILKGFEGQLNALEMTIGV